MQYFIGFSLTFILSSAIIIIMKNKINKKMSRTLYSQKDTHELFKYFFAIDSSNNRKKRFSQLTNHVEKSMIKVMVIGHKAYWVSDNTFYVANAIDGEVEAGSAEPVDIDNMSKNDINKMLFILDNLQNGNKNDSGSSGNERI